MGGSNGSFKGRLFGGFDRRDVVDYIEKLAQERNGYKKEIERLREENMSLHDRLSDAEEQAAEQRRAAEEAAAARDEQIAAEKAAAVEKLGAIVDALQSEYDAVCESAQESVAALKAEIDSIGAKLDELVSKLGEGKKKLDGMKAEISLDCDAPACECGCENEETAE